MAFLNLSIDCWQVVGSYLNSDDLFSMAATCKSAYKAFSRPVLKDKISFPLVKPYRLTMDQREVLQKMETLNTKVKLISGSVGSGKTIVSLAYGFRQPFKKIVVVTPPNLIKMWWDTVIKFFDEKPLVLHDTNPKYDASYIRNQESVPEKIIITSYKILDNLIHRGCQLFRNCSEDLLIIDEAHHTCHVPTNFKDIIALSATVFRRNNLSYGIRHLCDLYGVNVDNIIFNMEKTVIASKLKPVVHLEPHLWKLDDMKIRNFIYRRKWIGFYDDNDLRDIPKISEVLSHPFIPDLENSFAHLLTVNGKKLALTGIKNSIPYYHKMDEARKIVDSRLAVSKEIIGHKEKKKRIDALIEEMGFNFNAVRRQCTKYYQCLAIAKQLEKRREKGIIFDNSVTYLPFLYKFLTDKGIKCYLFSTHYSVAERQKQLDNFKHDGTILLSSIAMLGEGHNVTEANHIIFLTSNMDANKYYQALGRCWRYPQSKTVNVHYLFNSMLDKKIHEHSQGTTNLVNLNWDVLLTA